MGLVCGRTDFHRFFLLSRRKFSRILSLDFFFLAWWEKCPEKSCWKIPSKILKNVYNKNLRYISAEGPGQQVNFPRKFHHRISPTNVVARNSQLSFTTQTSPVATLWRTLTEMLWHAAVGLGSCRAGMAWKTAESRKWKKKWKSKWRTAPRGGRATTRPLRRVLRRFSGLLSRRF